MTAPLLDARGVEIQAGDTVIYGFGVSRSVAMAEGVVVGQRCVSGCTGCGNDSVSLTPTGLVRIRVVRRSYSSGSKPVVNLMPDRIVVLKPSASGICQPHLPISPLSTQEEEYRAELEAEIARYEASLQLDEPPEWWKIRGDTLKEYRAQITKWLAESRRKLEALDG